MKELEKFYDSNSPKNFQLGLCGPRNKTKHRAVGSFFMVVKLTKNVSQHGWPPMKTFKIILAKMS